MVDKINPLGQVPNAQKVRIVQKQHEEADTKNTVTPNVDKVEISEEALSLAKAENAARQVSEQLSSDVGAALTNDTARLNALI